MSKRTNTAKWIESQKRWQIKVQQNGVRKTFYSSTPGRNGQREANAKADKWLEAGKDAVQREKVTVLDAVREWEESLKLRTSKGNWRPAISRVEKWVIPYIGHRLATDVTQQDFQDVIDRAYAQGKLKAKTLKNLRGDLTGIAKFCRKSNYSAVRTDEIDLPKQAQRSAKKILTPGDLEKVFSRTDTIYKGRYMEDHCVYAYRFLIATGLRPGELLGLRRTDIQGGYLIVSRSYNDNREITGGKNENARRKILLPTYAVEALAGQLSLLKKSGLISPVLFPDKSGEYMRQEAFRTQWYRFCNAHGIQRVSPYELRHTFVSITKDMPEGLKKMIVGHSKDMDTDGIYSHEFSGDHELAVRYVEDAFRRALDMAQK